MQVQSQQHGLDVQRFEAINGRSLVLSELLRERKLSILRPFSIGTVGCYLSHRTCWELIANGEHNAMLIVEDDVKFTDGILEKWTELMANLPEWDLVYLGLTRPRGKKIHSNIYRAVPQGNQNAGAYAYMITRDGAKKLLDMCAFPMADMVDHCMKNNHTHLKTFFVYPYIVQHDFTFKTVRLPGKVYSKTYMESVEQISPVFEEPRN